MRDSVKIPIAYNVKYQIFHILVIISSLLGKFWNGLMLFPLWISLVSRNILINSEENSWKLLRDACTVVIFPSTETYNKAGKCYWISLETMLTSVVMPLVRNFIDLVTFPVDSLNWRRILTETYIHCTMFHDEMSMWGVHSWRHWSWRWDKRVTTRPANYLGQRGCSRSGQESDSGTPRSVHRHI